MEALNISVAITTAEAVAMQFVWFYINVVLENGDWMFLTCYIIGGGGLEARLMASWSLGVHITYGNLLFFSLLSYKIPPSRLALFYEGAETRPIQLLRDDRAVLVEDKGFPEF